MPYRDSEKARESSKERMRRYRERQGVTVTPVTPLLRPDVTPAVTPKSEVISQLRSVIAGVGKVEPKPIVPLYNASIHHAGDRVRVFDGNRLVEMVIPELDAEGQAMPQSSVSISLLSSSNLFEPSFNPVPKPAKKEKKKRSFK